MTTTDRERRPGAGEPGNTRLRAARLARPSPTLPGEPMSRAELAEAVTAHLWEHTGRQHALDAHTIARYERGAITWPSAPYRAALRAVLGVTTDADLGFRPTRRRQVRLASGVAADDDARVQRRDFLHAATGLALSPRSAASLVELIGPVERFERPRLGADDVASLRWATEQMRVRDQRSGGAGLRETARDLYGLTRRLLHESNHTAEVGIDLTALAADLAVTAGWTSYDTATFDEAERLFTEAFVLADEIRHGPLMVRAMDKLVLHAGHRAVVGSPGHGHRAVRLAERLGTLSRGEPSPRLHALVCGRQAVASAAAGDRAGFGRAALRAWREVERLDDEPTDDLAATQRWLSFVTPAEIAQHIARGHRCLDEFDRAVGLLREHAADPGLLPRNRINLGAQLATTLCRGGEVSGAESVATTVLDDLEAEGIRSPRTVALLSPVHERSTDPVFRHRFALALGTERGA